MFAGSVTRRTSTPVSLILARVFSSLRAYSSSGNAAIRHLLGRLPVEQQVLEHALSGVELAEVDPLVRPVRRLLDVARSEQNAWYPRAVNEETRVTRGTPCRDPARDGRFGHRRAHRLHELVVARCLKGEIVRARDHFGLEPGHSATCPCDRLLQLLHHLLCGLARVDPAVHLDLAAIRHDVRTRAAVDRAHSQGRWPELGMATARELRVDRLELECDPRGGGDRVTAHAR